MSAIRKILVVLVIVVAAGAVIASGSDNKATKVGGGSDSSKSAQAFKVGDEVKLGDWTVKVWGVTDPYTSTNQFLKAKDGFRWVSLDTEIKNSGSSSSSVSSLLCFKVQDSANREYTETVADAQPGPPDGEVAAGAAKRGNVVFEVPVDATGLKLNFKCDLFSSGTATVQLS